MFVILTEAFVNVIILLYLFIYTFLKQTPYFLSVRVTMGVIMCFNAILILIVLYASEIPVKQVTTHRYNNKINISSLSICMSAAKRFKRENN